MSWYTADLGTWERGKVVKFKAKSDSKALRRAFSMCQRLQREDVVQLRRCKRKPTSPLGMGPGKVIWDYYAGWYERQAR
jgi:hypothetical protein